MDETQPAAAVPVEGEGDGMPEAVNDEQDTRLEAAQATAAAAGGPSPVSATLQGLADKALDFLSHASNETLVACLVGLSATTYMVLGRVGLVIIGVAGGVVLHATWEGIRSDNREDDATKAGQARKREAGLDVARRVLALRTTGTADEEKPEEVKVYANQQLDFSSFGPDAATALDAFTNAIMKDYVHYWYDATLPGEESFPASCKRTLIAFLLSLSGHLGRKRPADAFLDFVTNASSIIIVFLNELSVALNASPNSSAEDAVAMYLEMKPDSSLSYMLNQDSQNAKLADIAEDILQTYLDPKMHNAPPVHVFLKEVLAQLVLGYTVTYCARPEFFNEWIVYGLEESETTKGVMDLVDAGVEGRTSEQAVKDAEPIVRQQEDESKKESVDSPAKPQRPVGEHKRQVSRAEDAMDEAMAEAKRLTQLMIEEDERRARDEQEKQAAASSSEDVSDGATQGAPTPTSSQSDRERQSEEAPSRGSDPSLAPESAAYADEPPMTPTTKQQFTSFDQLLPAQQPTALSDSPERARQEPAHLTLHNATISIFDDAQPHERTTLKTKPITDYLVQIEPSSSAFPGWMIARKYADFETLHEVLRRISVITGVPQFTQTHTELPRWRTNTKSSLRSELERYLTDAVRFQTLAESEGMKRFLEKDQGLTKSPSERNKGFGWPTPDAFGKFGGDMMNVLTNAPKQVAGSGKTVFSGVAGLVGGKKAGHVQGNLSRTSTSSAMDAGAPVGAHRGRSSTGQPFITDSHLGSMSSSSARQSQESVRSPAKPTRERQGSVATTASSEFRPRPSLSSSRLSREFDTAVESVPGTAEASPTASQTQIAGLDIGLETVITLPPPPSEIADDFGSVGRGSRKSTDTFRSSKLDQQMSASGYMDDLEAAPSTPPRPTEQATPKPQSKPKEPLTERETSVAIELMFAVITELYTLSSVWQIRRTLLAAAKTFLLRPGNPQLLTIRDMLQTSMLDSNLSDHGIAAHVYKLRENSLPTTEELEVWKRDFPEKTEEQKEELRVKARRLLVSKGMPQALTSVMGAAASGEALGKVFDCLQVPEVGRGLVFGLVLQALRVVTH
ncbi:hypothetical protein LTR36_008565 [Oleoguttula mirabilis]|uniref:PXA domain-containing protein n=1 Tax=Oleoguttula mirabilis TaxID=1507867 RepID=A0AAV9JUN8_9PEZI|nr:hypothetical protein LTR36_008565 [Oleoguttula mirabilis]